MSTSLFLVFTSSLFSSFPVYGQGDIVKVKDKNDTKPIFHRLMIFFNFFKVELRDMEKKELSLVGKDNVVEKVIVKKDKSLFGKDFKVVFSFVRSSSFYPCLIQNQCTAVQQQAPTSDSIQQQSPIQLVPPFNWSQNSGQKK